MIKIMAMLLNLKKGYRIFSKEDYTSTREKKRKKNLENHLLHLQMLTKSDYSHKIYLHPTFFVVDFTTFL